MQHLKNIVAEVRKVGQLSVLHVHVLRKSPYFIHPNIAFLMTGSSRSCWWGVTTSGSPAPNSHLKESSVTQSQEIISEWGTLVWNEAGTSTCQPEAAEEEPGTDDEIVDSDTNDRENEHEGSKEDRDDEVEEEAPSKGTYQERSFWIVY